MSEDELRRALAPPTVSARVVGRVLGISINLVYRSAKSGDLEVIEIGRAKKFPTAPIRRKLGLLDLRAA